jgi:fluoride ion exporter CrcB/FEX
MLLQSGARLSALIYVAATLVACFIAGLIGIAVARLFVGS